MMINLGRLIRFLSLFLLTSLLSSCKLIDLTMQSDADSLALLDEVKQEEAVGEGSEEAVIHKLKETRPYTTWYWGVEHKNFQAIQRSLEEIDVKKNGSAISLQFSNNDQIIAVGPLGKYNHTSTLLHLAVMYDNSEATKLLLSCDNIAVNQINQRGETPFHWALQNNNLEIIKLFLAHKYINVNQRDKCGQTPLYWAIRENNTEAVKLLLAREDIDVNLKDNLGDTVLYPAIMHSNVEIMRLLIKHEDFDVNQKNDNGENALYWAVLENNADAVRFLLDRDDIDLKQTNDTWNTPLHLAVVYKDAEVAKLLIEHTDTDVNQENNDGETPLYWAVKENNTDAVKLLLARNDIDLSQTNDLLGNQLHLIAKFCSYNLINEVLASIEEKFRLARVGSLSAVYEKFLLGRKASYSHYDRQVLKMLLAYTEFNLNLSNHEGKTCADLLRDRGMQAEARRIEAIAAKYLNQDK
jgi:ankyrin repeat protein